ncbi:MULTISPECIES: SemiSWEET family sugar transporter [Enterobacteriaceae]|uniref:SemiSWEET family sugar transporter n=1 Tax=Enterobacteriaceae TaxID=543 RepID=UPI0008633148|nr:SemiSWEET family transporter [Klebsiella sp. LTGPAF-6F]AOV10036.1 hypothetical protein BJF97_02905 [Klebsiella sp. LTGPAF-6F]
MKSILIVISVFIATIICIALLSPWPFAIGTLAAWVTTGSFFIQVLHILKNKDTTGISLGMYASLFFGVTCWAFYGIKIGDWLLIVANVITMLLASSVIFLKLYHERKSSFFKRLSKKSSRIKINSEK